MSCLTSSKKIVLHKIFPSRQTGIVWKEKSHPKVKQEERKKGRNQHTFKWSIRNFEPRMRSTKPNRDQQESEQKTENSPLES